MKRITFLTVGGAFFVLVILIVAQTVNSIHQLEQIQHRQTNRVIETNARKIDMVTRVQVAAHTRTDRLLRMAIEEDVFVRDALFLDFGRAGFMVGSARRALSELGFTAQEQARFDQQTEHIKKIESVQEKITDLMARDKVTEARHVLVAEAIPLQDQFTAMLAEFRATLQLANDSAMQTAEANYNQSHRMVVIYGVLATVLGIGLGWLTLYSLFGYAHKISQQVADLNASYKALEEEATHDPLTGLANRRLFYDRLQHALLQSKRHGKKLGVLFIDLNRFKEINDVHGHHVGDAVLTEVAARLVNSVRESDTVARIGGDEFVVLLEDLRDRRDCYTAVGKIEESLSGNANLYGLGLELSASIGQALFPDDGTTEDLLIRAADAAMYNIKTRMSEARQRSLFTN